MGKWGEENITKLKGREKKKMWSNERQNKDDEERSNEWKRDK